MKKQLKCVLLVDDDDATNFLNKRLLKKGGYTENIEVAENGQEAIEFLENADESNRPDIILLDINMPIMNGWEFLEAYEQLPPSKKAQVVIVMLTTSVREEDRTKAAERGEISAFVSKPLSADQMNKIMNANFPNFFE